MKLRSPNYNNLHILQKDYRLGQDNSSMQLPWNLLTVISGTPADGRMFRFEEGRYRSVTKKVSNHFDRREESGAPTDERALSLKMGTGRTGYLYSFLTPSISLVKTKTLYRLAAGNQEKKNTNYDAFPSGILFAFYTR